MKHRIDPEGGRLPIKLDSTSNGEFAPIALSRANHHANHLAQEQATHNAKRRAINRRDFLISSCGAASTLLAFNAANAAAGKTGGFYDLHTETALDTQLAAAAVEGDEFIFDVQGHFVDPNGDWIKKLPPGAKPLTFSPKTNWRSTGRSAPGKPSRSGGPMEKGFFCRTTSVPE